MSLWFSWLGRTQLSLRAWVRTLALIFLLIKLTRFSTLLIYRIELPPAKTKILTEQIIYLGRAL